MKYKRWLFWTGASLGIGAVVVLAVLHYGGGQPAAQAPPPRTHEALPVGAVTAYTGNVRAWVFAEGTARAVRREYLTFEKTGRIVYVKPGADGGELREGEAVRTGDLLARLDPRSDQAEVASAKAALVEAGQRVDAARADLEKATTLRDLAQATLNRKSQIRGRGGVTEVEYDQTVAELENAKASVRAAQSQIEVAQAGVVAAQARLNQAQVALEQTELRAPIDGIVAYLNVEEGYFFNPSVVRTDSESALLQTIPMVLIDPSTYEVTVDVPSYDSDHIEVGQPVLLVLGGDLRAAVAVNEKAAGGSEDATASLLPGYVRARGEVFSVNPAINPGGRSVRVKIRTTEGAQALRDGMFIAAWIATEERRNTVLIPFGTLVYRDDVPYVFVVDSNTGRVQKRAVELGIQGLSAQEVRAGVEAGDRLVTEGRYRLSDGAPVELAGGAGNVARSGTEEPDHE